MNDTNNSAVEKAAKPIAQAGPSDPSGELTVEMREKREQRAWRLVLTVYLLQALHVLFGITAVIGMLINHTNGHHVKGTIAESHFRWQIITFWIAAAGYTLTFAAWIHYNTWWPTIAVLLWVSYRINRGWWLLVARKPINSAW